jgi:hypothetical protein
VQRQVAVVVKLADRDLQPVSGADADHSVGLQGAQLADAQARARQHLDHQAVQGTGVGRCPHQRRRRDVIQETGERVVHLGQVGVENGTGPGGVSPAPFDDPLVELSVAYSQAIAADGLARGPELAVTRLGAGVVFHTRPGSDERLPVVLGYADSRGQWYRDGRRHVEVAAGLPEDVSGGVAL